MPPRAIAFFVVAAVLGVFAIGLRGLPVGHVATDPPVESLPAAAAPETLALPEIAVGATLADVSACFPARVSPRRVVAAGGPSRAAFEWSEPAGRYALFEFEHGGVVVGYVRRPWTAWLPAVEAARLPAVREGMSRADAERALGQGWPVMRALAPTDGPSVTHAWAIRDRGVGTGAVLLVGYRGDRVAVVGHPWVRS